MHLRFRDVRRSEGHGGRASQDVPRPAFPVSANFAGRSPLGGHRKKPTNFRISHRLSYAAAPALLGVAAAITLSAQLIPGPALASTLSGHSESAGQSWKVTNAELLAAIHPVAAQPQAAVLKAAASRQVHRPVRRHPQRDRREGLPRPGRVAGPVLGQPGKIRWANSIDAGQVLTVPAKPARIPAAPSQLGRPSAPVVHRPARSRRRPRRRRRLLSPSPRRARAPTAARAPSRSA